MKVLFPGVLAVNPFGGITLEGWHFDSEGEWPTDPTDAWLAMLAAAMNHIAHGVGLHGRITVEPQRAPDDRPEDAALENFDAQRLALDAIASARWPAKGQG